MRISFLLTSLAAAAASPLFRPSASVGGDPTFCYPTVGAAHYRQSGVSLRGPNAGVFAVREFIEQYIDNDAEKERQDSFQAVGASMPTPLYSSITDYQAGFTWSISYRSTPVPQCQKYPAQPKPGPNSQCGAPDGVTIAGTGTQGPISTTIFHSYADLSGMNITYAWVVAGDVPVLQNLLRFSTSGENSTWAEYQLFEIEDWVRLSNACTTFAHLFSLTRLPAPPSFHPEVS